MVIPNHFHGIIEIVGAGSKPARTEFANTELVKTAKNLSEVVRQFKTFSAKKINQSCHLQGSPVWQRNYHEHIIRNETAYLKISEYVQTNPQRWQEDCYF